MTDLLENPGADTMDDPVFRTFEGSAEDITELQGNIDDQLAAIFAEFGGGDTDVHFSIKIYRVLENQGDYGYCFACVPSELPVLDRIREEFGAGKYEIRTYQKGRKGKKAGLFKRHQVTIAQRNPTPKRAGESGGDINAIIRAMQEMQQENFRQMQELLKGNSAPAAPASVDPLDSMSKMMEIMARMQGFVPQQQSPMDMLKPVLELVGQLSDSGREKGLYDVIGSALEKAMPLLTAAAGGAAQRPPAIPGPAPGGAAGRNNEQIPASSGGHPPMNNENPSTQDAHAVFRQQLGMLVAVARTGVDPTPYAEMILDNVDDDQLNQLLYASNLRESLEKYDPALREEPVWQWFERLRVTMLGLLTDETGTGDTVGNESAGPEKANAANDITAGKGDASGHT